MIEDRIGRFDPVFPVCASARSLMPLITSEKSEPCSVVVDEGDPDGGSSASATPVASNIAIPNRMLKKLASLSCSCGLFGLSGLFDLSRLIGLFGLSCLFG